MPRLPDHTVAREASLRILDQSLDARVAGARPAWRVISVLGDVGGETEIRVKLWASWLKTRHGCFHGPYVIGFRVSGKVLSWVCPENKDQLRARYLSVHLYMHVLKESEALFSTSVSIRMPGHFVLILRP
jgi:hypothetical protein